MELVGDGPLSSTTPRVAQSMADEAPAKDAMKQAAKAEAILQTTVSRFDPRTRRVSPLEHLRLLFHPATLPAKILVLDFKR